MKDATLPYEYDGLRFVADVVTRSIAWPSSKMKPYKPGHLPHPATKDAVRLCMEDKRNKKEP
uniref:Transposase Tnp1/En/Spm-like domain-containing protein n=2 Tax=Aegilops tauschii subsp. strangulata TaxID=200361 RepID=A0A453HJQ6_AEGTS